MTETKTCPHEQDPCPVCIEIERMLLAGEVPY